MGNTYSNPGRVFLCGLRAQIPGGLESGVTALQEAMATTLGKRAYLILQNLPEPPGLPSLQWNKTVGSPGKLGNTAQEFTREPHWGSSESPLDAASEVG